MKRSLGILVLVVMVIGAGLWFSGGQVKLMIGGEGSGFSGREEHAIKGERTINVSGAGSVTVLPDEVRVTIGVKSFAKDAAAALDINSEKMTRVVEGLLSLGLNRNDIQTSDFELERRADKESISAENPEGLVGYDVRNMITVETDQVGLIGTILEEVIGWGATNVGGLYFSVSNEQELIKEARSLAIENARSTAEEIADAAGVLLGPILLVNESSEYYRETLGEKQIERLEGDMPLYMTQERIRAGVMVTFAIK